MLMRAKNFEDFGIRVPHGRTGEVDVTCPQCSAQRKKKTARCLSVNIDKRVWCCAHCGWAGGLSEGEKRFDPSWRKPQFRRPAPLEQKPLSAIEQWFIDRCIPASVLERNHITLANVYMPQLEEHVDAFAFPYLRDDELVNVKYRDAAKNFRMETGAERILYGLNDIKPERCVIVEGEVDKLSVEVAGITSCVSVPDGAPAENAKNYASKFTFLEADEERIGAVAEWIIAVDNDAPGQRLEDELARRLGREKCRRVRWPNDCKDANDVLRSFGPEVLRECLDNAELFPLAGVFDVSDLSDRIDHLYEHGWEKGISTGWEEVDRFYTVRAGEFSVITGMPNSGKALALNTPVPTLHGWSTMGEMQVGDIIFDDRGGACRVTHAFDVMINRPCYRITFSDGSEIVADADHQWVTRDDRARHSEYQSRVRRGDRQQTLSRGSDQRWKKTYPSTKTTREIAETLLAPDGRRNHSISVAQPIECPDRVLPISPYTLGAWLGDGTSACGAITAAEDEIIGHITADGYSATRMPSTKYGYTITGLIGKLRALGVLGSKLIPAEYLRASVRQRRELLAGLMDTDGFICRKTNRCEFSNTSETLARGTFELAASLGLRPRISVGVATLYGKDCGAKYRVSFTPLFNPFKLSRKAAVFTIPKKSRRIAYRVITAVEPVPSVPVRCISVDSPTHQFLVGWAFIPTHNSNWLDCLLVNLANQHGWHFAIFSPENQPLEDHMARMCEKWARLPFANGLMPRMSRDVLKSSKDWVRTHFSWILPDDDSEWTVETVLDRAKSLVLRKGIRGLVIDPWNELEHHLPPGMTETIYIGLMLKRARQFARRHGVHVWIVAHPQKLYRDRQSGEYPVPTLYDISASANWRNKADNGIVVYRNFNEPKDPVEVHVQKVRFRQIGKIGMAKLQYDHPTQTYRDLSFDDRRNQTGSSAARRSKGAAS